jgi:tetratricopeptide (TPR) repeat protein
MNGRYFLELLYRMLGQYEKAKKEAQAGLEYAEEIAQSNWKRAFYNLLANYDLANGDLDGVMEKADFIWESALKEEISGWQTAALWWKIQVYLEQNNIEKALELTEEAKKILDNTPSIKDIRDHLDNLALIEMKRENYPKAIDLFTQVYELQGSQRGWFSPHANILFDLASAYYLNGDMEMAKKEHENILSLTSGRLFGGDLYVRSFYMLGKIYEQQGDTDKAIEHYEKFLDLWKDADPGIAEVEDARERLAGLKGGYLQTKQ